MTKNKRGRRSSGRKTKDSYNVDREIINDARASGSTTSVISSDVSNRPQNFNITQRPPKQIGNQIFWGRFSFDTQATTSTSGPTEINYNFLANQFNGVSGFLGVFDQYCIYAVTMTWFGLTFASPGNPIRLMTALDYDNSNAVGSSGIQAFSSYNETMLAENTSLVRMVKPCVSPVISGSTGAGVLGSGITRQWIDAAAQSIPHYGIRSVYPGVFSGTSTVEISVSAIFGFRNNI